MKRIAILLALATVLACFAGCMRAPAEPLPAETKPAAPALSETGTPGTTGAPEETASADAALPDFSVKTIDGGTFTLSEALQDHELVLINLWATWCGPCEMEFPYLQEAWSQRADRVAVVALSVEPEDTDAVLRRYADEHGLTFPIGHAADTDLGRFVTEGIPTSVLVDRLGQVAAVEVGAKTSTQAFLDLFDGLSGADYDPSRSTFTVFAYDARYQPVSGVVVNFCTDTTCTPVTTDADGTAVFTGPRTSYHVQVLTVPEGMQFRGASEFELGPWGEVLYLPLAEAGR